MTVPAIRKSPSTGPGRPDVWGVYEPDTGSIQYVCACPETRQAALIDVVWNFDPRSFATSTHSMDQVLDLCRREGLEVVRILDTHPHADHLMAAAQLRARTGAPIAIGEKVRDIAALWRDIYDEPDAFDVDADFDHLLADGDTVQVGRLTLEVELSPGHTLGSVSFHAGDASFVHDTLMMPDMGSTRADFPGGSARQLWASIRSILDRPAGTRVFVGHDYGAAGRDTPAWEASVAEHRASNRHARDGIAEDAFVEIREARDATLPLPDRMLAALQVNLRGGRLPAARGDGGHYLKMPVDRF